MILKKSKRGKEVYLKYNSLFFNILLKEAKII